MSFSSQKSTSSADMGEAAGRRTAAVTLLLTAARLQQRKLTATELMTVVRVLETVNAELRTLAMDQILESTDTHELTRRTHTKEN